MLFFSSSVFFAIIADAIICPLARALKSTFPAGEGLDSGEANGGFLFEITKREGNEKNINVNESSKNGGNFEQNAEFGHFVNRNQSPKRLEI